MAFVLQSCPSCHVTTKRFFLGFFWVSGLILGAVLYCTGLFAHTPLMLGRYYSSVSIVGFFLFISLPYLLTVFSVLFLPPWVLFVFCFLKGISFSLVSLCIINSFQCGWLIRLFIMFFEIFSVPTLYVCWSRILVSGNHGSVTECLGWFCFSLLLGSIDYRIISPIASGLLIL